MAYASVQVRVFPSTYRDSVELMGIAVRVEQHPGVGRVGLVMATEANLAVLAEAGLSTDQARDAAPSDLVLTVGAEDEQRGEEALQLAQRLLREGGGEATAPSDARQVAPTTLSDAVALEPGLRLALISTPGAYATAEALKALKRGLHVFLFSDNVPVDDELELKRLAVRKDLLLMGPDCGTAILDGIPLGFANAVRRGGVGVVGASGTGMQEVTCLVDRGGAGVSQAIGVGGRDLSSRVGGLMMRAGLTRLAHDADTEVIVLVSKPPAPDVARSVLAAVRECGKPVVVCFLGGDPGPVERAGASFAPTLEEAARQALRQVGVSPSPEEGPPAGVERVGEGGRRVRGLYAGGTLAAEAQLLLDREALPDGSEVTDLGADEYTVGRPHPMIDPRLRNELLLQAGADPSVGVVLFDVVLGYGAHPDPAGALAPVVGDARRAAEADGRSVAFVASICGTDADPQGLAGQRQTLRDAGVAVAGSNAMAVRLAARLVTPAAAGTRSPR